jgi:GNAT superfamily N-acetyltransferase
VATPPRPTLRLAIAEDLELLARWNAQLIQDQDHEYRASHDELAARLAAWLAGDYTAAIAQVDREPVAYLLWRCDTNDVFLRQFFVSRRWRRRGLGRAIMEQAVGQFWAGQRIVLDVLSRNDRGQAFWRSIGFGDYSVRLRREPAGGAES